MKFSIFFLLVIIAEIIAVPLIREKRAGRMSNQIPQGDFIKIDAAHSSKYGSGGRILANKNIAQGKHYSVDAQAKYNQFGRFKEGWAGINYALRWRK